MYNLPCQKNHTSNQGTNIFKHRKDFRLGFLPLWYEYNLLDYWVIGSYYNFFGGKKEKKKKEKTHKIFIE